MAGVQNKATRTAQSATQREKTAMGVLLAQKSGIDWNAATAC